MSEVSKAIGLAGLNRDGSAALAILAGEDGRVNFDEEPPMVLVLPVADYAAFVQAGGGNAGDAVAEVDPFEQGVPAYVKNLGGGFAAMGPVREAVEAFAGAAGQAAAHRKLMGPSGVASADASIIAVILDLHALAPAITAGMGEVKTQMEMMAAMGGGDLGAQAAAFDALSKTLVDEGQSGVVGFGVGDAGMSLNLALQFREGTETAGFMSGKGSAGALLDRVPNQPYLFAFAADMAPPGVKALFKKMNQAGLAANPEAARAMGVTDAIIRQLESIDGMSMLVGVSPALMMGGLFSNTSAYVKTRDAAGYAAAMKNVMDTMNGKTIQGFTYHTAYSAGAKQEGTAKADEWSMRMEPDPNDPNAAQAAMAMGMIFGPEGGLGGYLAPVDGGLVLTYSKNSQTLLQALDAAKGGGLGADAGVKAVASSLPPDRALEGYIGVGHILEMVQGMAAMFGGGGPQIDVPPDLPPIGIGASLNAGGARAVVFAPTKVLTTIKKMVDEMQGAGADPKNGAGQPRF